MSSLSRGKVYRTFGLYIAVTYRDQNGWCPQHQLWGFCIKAAVDPAERAEKRSREEELGSIEARQLEDW